MGNTPQEPTNSTLRLMTETEVAEIMAVSTATLRRWRWAGKGPLFRKIGSAVRYHPTDLDDYIEQARRTNTSQQAVLEG